MASCINDKAVEGPKTPTALNRTLSLSSSAAKFVENPTHGNEILKGLYEQFKAERFCDVSLIFEEKEIKAHKVVLASSCRYFEAMFSSNFKDGDQERLELPVLDDKTGTALVEFAYTGKVEITSENVQDLLAGANFLGGFQFIENSCCDFLKEGMNETNVFGIFQIADMFGLKTLKQDAKVYVLRHFMSVKDSDEFVQLPGGLLSELLSESGLLVVQNEVVKLYGHQEKVIVEALLKYLEHNSESRKVKTVELLEKIHLPLLKIEYLKRLKSNELLSDPECGKLIDKAMQIREEKKSSKSSEVCDWAKPRGCGEYQMWKGRTHANGGQVDDEVEKFNDVDKINLQKDYIAGMKLWIRRWDGRPVLGGVKVTYSNGESVMHGSDKGEDTHAFELEPEERITKLEVQSGWMVDQLKFGTNKEQDCGPYGGPGGGYRPEKPPGQYQYLACMQGSVVNTQGDQGITRLQFIWKVFRFPDEKPFADHKDPAPFEGYNEWDEDDYDDYDDYDLYEDYDDIPDDWYDPDIYDEFGDVEVDDEDFDPADEWGPPRGQLTPP